MNLHEPSCTSINLHQPSSTFINIHQHSSTFNNLHQPLMNLHHPSSTSSTFINHHLHHHHEMKDCRTQNSELMKSGTDRQKKTDRLTDLRTDIPTTREAFASKNGLRGDKLVHKGRLQKKKLEFPIIGLTPGSQATTGG